MELSLPCGCAVEINPDTFKSGERGASCPRHERSFIVQAQVPHAIRYVISQEVRYEKPREA